MVSDVASRGFVTPTQMQQITEHLNNLNFSTYLQRVTWKPTIGLGTSINYKQFIELDKLQSDTIAWVNKTIPAINQVYQDALTQAESGINMHGYKLSDLLNGNQLPKTKAQIDNYKDGLSFHNWLQSQANNLYFNYQLKLWIPISLLLVIVSAGVSGLYI